MDEDHWCPSTLPGRVQLPDSKGTISIQSPLHPTRLIDSREQKHLLYIAFIDLAKAFDLVSRSGHFTLLHRIGCPLSS